MPPSAKRKWSIWTVVPATLNNSFLNVGKVFNAIARIFSGASSIINNVNVIYQSFLTLGDLLKSF